MAMLVAGIRVVIPFCCALDDSLYCSGKKRTHICADISIYNSIYIRVLLDWIKNSKGIFHKIPEGVWRSGFMTVKLFEDETCVLFYEMKLAVFLTWWHFYSVDSGKSIYEKKKYS